MSKPRKNPIGDRNIVGEKVASLRKQKKIKQKDMVAMLRLIIVMLRARTPLHEENHLIPKDLFQSQRD